MLNAVRHIILGIIDFFHKPFAKWINLQTFRYLACGGSNTVLDITIYSLTYNFVFHKQPVPIGPIEIAPYIAAFMVSFCISFPTGFVLSKYIVFPESNVHGKVQLLRYAMLVGMCILLNYIFLKVFIEWFGLFPTISKVLTTLLVAVFSFIAQRNFTFKVKEVVVKADENDLLV